MNLKELKNQTILLLGKSRAFSEEEFSSQMSHHTINYTKEYSDTIRVIVEGRMMTPYEQNLVEELYEKGGYEFLDIDTLEKELAASIDDATLLMSLKLSNDKERLKSFLQNNCISDELFFKLLKMYKWSGEDFFENDDNRDITAALIGRFYENIERNHNVQYATTGVIHLIRQTKNSQLLEAIASLEPLKFHPKIRVELASNAYTPPNVLKRFLKFADKEALEAMAYNKNLDKKFAQELIEDEYYARIIAQNILLDEELFETLLEYKEDLARNETLSDTMQERLVNLNDRETLLVLAQNSALNEKIVEKLLSLNDDRLNFSLYANSATASKLLQEAYKEEKYHLALAQNSAAPKDILEALYARGESEILDKIARNESTPVEILYQLQLDSRFDRAVKTNRAFGEHIQSENIGWLI